MNRGRLESLVAWIQGIYYLATGLWALVDIASFQVVTGPKTDLWLVRTVGVLVAVIGAVLIVAVRRRRVSDEIRVLAIGSALGLAAIDVVYASTGVISDIYVLDAAAEVGLAVLWMIARRPEQ